MTRYPATVLFACYLMFTACSKSAAKGGSGRATGWPVFLGVILVAAVFLVVKACVALTNKTQR